MYNKEIDAKFILLGTIHTGKSSFLHRLQYGTHPFHNTTTIGIDYAFINRDKVHNNLDVRYRINFWDAGGHSTYMNVIRSFYRRVCGALIFFDVNDHKTFLKAKEYYDDFKKFDNSYKQFYLIGNKIDKNNRDIDDEEILDFTRENNIHYIECSVLLNKNIDELLNKILDNLEEDTNMCRLNPSFENGLKIHYNTMSYNSSLVSLNKKYNDKKCCIIS